MSDAKASEMDSGSGGKNQGNDDGDFRQLVETYETVPPADAAKARVAELGKQETDSIHPLLMAMIAIVAADGRVLEVEVEKVARTYAKVFGTEVTETHRAWIAQKAQQVFEEGYDVYDDLAAQRSEMDPAMIPVIFKACCSVAMCDGKVTDEELILLLRMTRALGMSLDEIKEHAAHVRLK